jgi:hypothetical protein
MIEREEKSILRVKQCKRNVNFNVTSKYNQKRLSVSFRKPFFNFTKPP